MSQMIVCSMDMSPMDKRPLRMRPGSNPMVMRPMHACPMGMCFGMSTADLCPWGMCMVDTCSMDMHPIDTMRT